MENQNIAVPERMEIVEGIDQHGTDKAMCIKRHDSGNLSVLSFRKRKATNSSVDKYYEVGAVYLEIDELRLLWKVLNDEDTVNFYGA